MINTSNTQLLLDVWREVGRHLELQESARTITGMLSSSLPLEGMLIRSFDPTTRNLETVAIGGGDSSQFAISGKTTLSEAKARRLIELLDSGELLHQPRRRRSGDALAIVPPEIEGEVLMGPLKGTGGASGFLLIYADLVRSFQPSHLQLFGELIEPFSAALDNHCRLHELALLREAAEADRRHLLTRLGRQDVNEQIVGADAGLRSVMERVELVAQSDVPVLILGETGTGKEVVSRAIHQRSGRAAGPFIRVNCGAIPSELIDSQLFGHEKGSFTGAGDTRKGWFERADGGTLFLDEIGELPLPAQVRLLRVLQDGFIERVGGQLSIRVDVRIVAATHRDLASMVKNGTFREDLWYRINVFPILLPRLRERREDIPALVRHFAQRAANRFGLTYVEPNPAELQLLMTYTWPGNIRELGAVIDRAAILGDGKRLDVAKALGSSFVAPPTATSTEPTFYEVIPESIAPRSIGTEDVVGPLDTLDLAMKRHIEKALIVTEGRIEGVDGAADILGINPHTLRARMRKLDIRWSGFRRKK